MELKSGKFQKNNGSFVSFVIGFGLKIALSPLSFGDAVIHSSVVHSSEFMNS